MNVSDFLDEGSQHFPPITYRTVNNSDGDENNGTLYNAIPNYLIFLRPYAKYAGRYSEKDMLSLI